MPTTINWTYVLAALVSLVTGGAYLTGKGPFAPYPSFAMSEDLARLASRVQTLEVFAASKEDLAIVTARVRAVEQSSMATGSVAPVAKKGRLK